MNSRTLPRLVPLVALISVVSCASSGYAPQTPSMPAAREALRPEYRLFYDALQDYGDWQLIEPVGFVFRPRVDFATFRPYQDGFWAPSDPYGWVWISAEPFGWATYHYGFWFWDRFQGWVWTPGSDWGPAWVSWQVAGDYAAWAALPPPGQGLGNVPGGAYVYAPLGRLGATDLRGYMTIAGTSGMTAETPHPIENLVERDGVRFNAGPPFALVERARDAPLPRVKIEDAPGSAGAAPRKQSAASAPAPASPANETYAGQVQAARAAANAAAREVRQLMEHGGSVPAKVGVVRVPAQKPAVEAPAETKPVAKKSKGAPADSTP